MLRLICLIAVSGFFLINCSSGDESQVTGERLQSQYENIAKATLLEAAKKHAPINIFHPDEQYFADDVQVMLKNTKTECGSDNRLFLQTKEALSSPGGVQSWFTGRDPNASGYKTPPIYVMARTSEGNEDQGDFKKFPKAQVIMTYFGYYPYNLGKKPTVCPNNKIFKTTSPATVGNHIGDWERHTVILTLKEGVLVPIMARFDFHAWEVYYDWNTGKWVAGAEDITALQAPEYNLRKKGDRALVYIGRGGHGAWTKPGNHTYKKVAGVKGLCDPFLDLFDETGDGARWDTSKNVFLITEEMWQLNYTDDKLNAYKMGLNGTGGKIINWLTGIFRWGNDGTTMKNSCGYNAVPEKICAPFPFTKSCVYPRKKVEDVLSECQLNHGPTGPNGKELTRNVVTNQCIKPPCYCGK